MGTTCPADGLHALLLKTFDNIKAYRGSCLAVLDWIFAHDRLRSADDLQLSARHRATLSDGMNLQSAEGSSNRKLRNSCPQLVVCTHFETVFVVYGERSQVRAADACVKAAKTKMTVLGPFAGINLEPDLRVLCICASR